MPEIVFKGRECVYNHHLTVPYRPLLPLSGGTQTEVICDLVFEADWRGTLEHRYFASS